MKRFLMNVVTVLRGPAKGRAARAGARPQLECLPDRLLPSGAPLLTGDTFYLSNHASDPDKLIILSEDAAPGRSTRSFVGLYLDNQHGFTDVVSGTITATGAVTPGMNGVPISTISFIGSAYYAPGFFETVSFTGQVYGAGYNPSLSANCQANSIDGWLTEWVALGSTFYARTFEPGSDWYQCIL
jgi:hypothetical protein